MQTEETGIAMSMEMETPFSTALQAHQAGDIATAQSLYQALLLTDPNHFDALHMLGVSHLQQGDNALACTLIEQAIRINDSYAPAYNNLVCALNNRKLFEKAAQNGEKAFALAPESWDTLVNLAVAYAGLENFERALACLDLALALQPDCVPALTNRGRCLFALSKHAPESERQSIAMANAALQQATLLSPNDPSIPFEHGALLSERGDYALALQAYQLAIAREPGHMKSLVNSSLAFNKLGLLDEARQSLERAAAYHPKDPEIPFNLGSLLAEHVRDDEALEAYDRALAIDPAHAHSLWNRALALLRSNRYEEGWPAYEARISTFSKDYALNAIPRWRGPHAQPLAGLRIVILQEQGLGDMLQFCRYIALLAAQHPAHIAIACDLGLHRLLHSSLAGVGSVLTREALLEQAATFDCYDYCLSLPAKFESTTQNLPNHLPYLQVPLEHKVADSAPKTHPSPSQPQLQVGIFWAGGHRPDQPETWDIEAQRSLPWEQILPLLDAPSLKKSVQWTILQRDRRESTLTAIAKKNGWHDPFADQDASAKLDLLDTAHMVQSLDLVIGVDSALVHLVGAMGQPIWMLDRFNHCWRWQKQTSDSIWYPKVLRIFRQTKPQQWSEVIADVTQALERYPSLP